MTQDQEIREAIEYFKNFPHIECSIEKTEEYTETLLDLAQRYLSCSSMMPEKKELDDIVSGLVSNELDASEGLTELINIFDDCRLFYAKKLLRLNERTKEG